MKYFISNKIPSELAKQKAQPIIPVVKSVYNATNNYGDYLLPILLILILQQTLIIAFGQSVVHEFKHGVLVKINEMSFFNYLKIISAKCFYYLLLYTAYFFVFYKVIFPHFAIKFNGSIIVHLLLSLLFITAVLLYTILVASFFKTLIGWTEVMAFSTYPLFLVSGFSWPVEAMPGGLQVVANILPSTPFFSIYNALATEGAEFRYITSGLEHLLAILLFGFVLLFVRFYFMRKTNKKQYRLAKT